LVDVIDKGIMNRGYGPKPTVELRFQLESHRADGKPYLITKWYNNTINEGSTLRKDIESWFAKKIPPEKEDGFDLESLLLKNCTLVIIQKPGKLGKMKSRIQSILPPPANAPKLFPSQYIRQKDREESPQAPPPLEEEEIPF
jgi:hypothetical protein